MASIEIILTILMYRPLLLILMCFASIAFPHNSKAEVKQLSGPIEAQVLRVIDGDSLVVRAQIWLGQEVTTHVRVQGIDTPELRGKCDHERNLARQARDHVTDWVSSTPVILKNIKFGKYAGRVLADVEHSDGHSLSEDLIAHGHARRYTGGSRLSWCD